MFFANIKETEIDFWMISFESLRGKCIFEMEKLDTMEFVFGCYFEEVLY